MHKREVHVNAAILKYCLPFIVKSALKQGLSNMLSNYASLIILNHVRMTE